MEESCSILLADDNGLTVQENVLCAHNWAKASRQMT
jgi:hypothetical protein